MQDNSTDENATRITRQVKRGDRNYWGGKVTVDRLTRKDASEVAMCPET